MKERFLGVAVPSEAARAKLCRQRDPGPNGLCSSRCGRRVRGTLGSPRLPLAPFGSPGLAAPALAAQGLGSGVPAGGACQSLRPQSPFKAT